MALVQFRFLPNYARWMLGEHAGPVSRGSNNNGTASGDSELKIAEFTVTGRRADRSRSRF
jgi:hypothetical protein